MSKGGRIINIGSILGERSLFPGVSDYAATKGAVSAYTKGWARDFGAQGITVNNIQPGPIDTDMNPMMANSPTRCGRRRHLAATASRKRLPRRFPSSPALRRLTSPVRA